MDKDGNRQEVGDLVFGRRPSVTQVASRVRAPLLLFFISFVILLLTLLHFCTLSPAALHKFSTIIQLCIIV